MKRKVIQDRKWMKPGLIGEELQDGTVYFEKGKANESIPTDVVHKLSGTYFAQEEVKVNPKDSYIILLNYIKQKTLGNHMIPSVEVMGWLTQLQDIANTYDFVEKK